MTRNNGLLVLAGFVAGAAAGATVALLTAPRPGRETRARIRGAAEEFGHKAAVLPHAAREACGRAAEAAREAFSENLRGN